MRRESVRRLNKDNARARRVGNKFGGRILRSIFRAPSEGGRKRSGIIGCEKGFPANACKVRIQMGVEIAEG